jgi:hypothetical protein
MNKEQYINMRKTGQYDFGLFYQYYLQHKDSSKAVIPFEMFVQAFRMYFQMTAREVLDLLDKKFEVQKIEDQQGNLLYIN